MKNVSLAQLSGIAPFVANEDQPLSIAALSLTNGSSTLRSVSHAVHGTVTLVKGKVVFTPDADFSGIAQFDYTLVDSHGVVTVHTATIDVAPVADAPTLSVTPVLKDFGAANKQGGEFLVNTTTAGGQFYSSVATFANGGFVMAWTDTSGTGGDVSNSQVRAQVFDASGHKVGSEFRVNTTTNLDQRKPEVSVLANGDFVVVWEDASGLGGDATGGALKAQVFHANGSKVGTEFLVNTTTQGTQDGASITALANGGFVVAWEDNSGVGGDSSDSSVKAQLFDASGHKVGGEFLVNTVTSGFQGGASVTSLKNGGFVVTWEDDSGLNGDGTRSGSIKAQVFDANGNKVGGELLVNPNDVNFAQENATVTALSSGGFAVTWEASANFGPDTSDSAIKLQIFDASSNKVGGEVVVNTSTFEYQKTPVITELSNGDIVVVWEDHSGQNGDALGTSIKAQVFDANGNKVGGEFLVNTSTAGDQQFPSVAALLNGSFIVSWSDPSGAGGDADGFGVKAQIFSVANASPNTPVKLNLSANLTDRDGSETLAVSVSSIAVGATLTDGVNSFTATANQTSIDISTWSFANLTVTPPQDFNGDLQLTVNATSTDHATLSTGAVTSSKTVSQTIDIFVAPLKGIIFDETLSGGSVAENAANGTLVGTAQGIDSLSGAAVLTYALVDNAGGRFAIDAHTGVITVANGTLLDFETATSHGIQVQVVDQTGASFVKSFNIAVTNVNEAPTNETLSGGLVIGNAANDTVVGTVQGVDPDAGSVLTYTLVDNAGGRFAINANTGVITVADGTKLDFATATSHAITVRVTDQGGLSFDKGFNITVTDPTKQFVAANEHAVVNEDSSFVISAASLIADSTNPSGATLSVSSVGNATHGTVSLVNGNVTFVSDTNFSGIASYDYTLSDASGRSSTATVTVDVAPVADEPALSVASNGSGAVTNVGGEFLVNTTTFGGQFRSEVASFADGGFVLAWADTSGTGGDVSNAQVRAQVFDASGHKVGTEFRVNTATDFEQTRPQVAVLANGDFVITWHDESGTGGDASGVSVKAQVYHRDGTKVGGEFLVNTTTQGNQDGASIAALGNGGFVVSWEDTSGAGGDSSGSSIKAQLFDAGGQKVGTEFLVNTITLNDQDLVSVASLKGGGFVATWQDDSGLNNDDTRSGSVKAQVFDANGTKVGGELLVDTKGINFANDVAHVTGLSNGGFVVTWEASANFGADTSDSSIQLQIFDASGNKVGTELEINTSSSEYQRKPEVRELSNGDLVVVWDDESEQNGDPFGHSIKAQVLDAKGNRIGGEFLVNTSTTGDQLFSTVAALANGSFIVSWTDDSGTGGDAGGFGVKAQIFSVKSTVQNTPLQLNLAANLTDTDGSETLAVSVSGIPVGATLTDGVNSFTATAGQTSVDVSTWSFSSLTVAPTQGFIGDFQLTVSATATDHATLSTGAVTDSKTVSQTIDVVVQAPPLQAAALVSPNTTGSTGNDVLSGGSGNDVLTGGGGNDTYQFGHGGGQDRIVNGTAASTGPSGELDFGAGINADQLWFQRNGNDLSIAVLGSHDQITVSGWFSGAGAQLAEIRTAGGMKIDAGVAQLVQAMATYSSAHAGFDPTTATQAPSDAGLQIAAATTWHQ
jgi:uncharacterized protein YheU (UPF0270 family)